MIRVARNAVDTTFNIAGLILGASFAVIGQVGESAAGLLRRGRRKAGEVADRAGDKAEDMADDLHDKAYDVAERADAAADSAVDAVVDAGAELTDALEVDDTDRRPYEERTVEELYELAQERDIAGRSQMNKAELIAALRADR